MTTNAASDYLENKVLDHTLRVASYTQPAGLYVGLHTSPVSLAATDALLEAGTLTNEVSTSGTAYVRKSVTFGAAASGTSSSNVTVTFDTATSDWGNITHISISDTVSSGNVLYWGQLTTAKTIQTGDTMQFVSTNITISLA